ncbi:MAG: DNA primase, partial [Patescibacteria group bacterium]|nr:DNA primase [Patescibacteria group bacterium]
MDQVSQVREKIDIVQLISEYVPLKKAGRNFKANCPFHGEKTPSFVVSPERQIWHCFGCGKGGDCFTFLMEYESLEFPEALRILAKRVGIEIQSTHFEAGLTTKKEKIYRLNRLSLEFYHYLLTKHNVGKKALSYLIEKRKINEKIIDSFSLGFAPRVGNALVKFLIDKKKYDKEDLNEAGLMSFRRGGIFDFFAGRIIFPLFDHRDNVIGFSGRVLEDQSAQISSKYINTRETLVYHKGDVFFGLNVAKDEIKKQGRVIVMEGELDVISSVQEGIKNVIAVKGTALTENQAQLISRFAGKVSLCFDRDKAGIDAVKRSVPVLEKKGLTITVVQVPNGKDPDESIKENAFEFKNAMKNDIG